MSRSKTAGAPFVGHTKSMRRLDLALCAPTSVGVVTLFEINGGVVPMFFSGNVTPQKTVIGRPARRPIFPATVKSKPDRSKKNRQAR